MTDLNSQMTDQEAATVATITARVNGFPAPGRERELDPEHAVFGDNGEVLHRGFADEHAAERTAETWRTTYYRPDAWAGELCNDHRDHPRETCPELC